MKYLVAILFTLSVPAGSSLAGRVALVVGVNTYSELSENHQLTSPVHDAKDVAAALVKLGYTLVTGAAVTDASRDGITTATEKFAVAARGAEAAVFYFSGHGVQVGEDNYLLPSDTPKLTGLSILTNRAVLLRSSVMVALEEAGVKTKVIILDCCRNNPFSAQLELALSTVGKNIRTKSLGQITGYGPGFYLAFATSPGQTAEDGNGQRNSPFTAAFLKAMPVSANKDIDFFFRDVKALLPKDQVSWTNHSITESFALAKHSLDMPTPSLPETSEPLVTMLPPGPPAPTFQQLITTPVETVAMPSTKSRDQLKHLFLTSPYDAYDDRQKSQILKLVQEKLVESGFDIGTPDGIPGAATQAALHSWQVSHNLLSTTRIDHETLDRMGLIDIPRVDYPPPQVPVSIPNPSRTSTPNVNRSPLMPRAQPKIQPQKTQSTTTPSRNNRDMSLEEFERRARALQTR